MKVKRKRGKDASLSNWCDHDSSLAELIPLSPAESTTEELAIEWSSSEEEKEDQQIIRKSSGRVQVPLKKLSPHVRKTEEVVDPTSVSPQRCDAVDHFPSCIRTADKKLIATLSEQLRTPGSNERKPREFSKGSFHPAQKVSPNEQQGGNPTSIQSGIVVDPLLTLSDLCDNDDLHISQVPSSLPSATVDEHRKSCSDDDDAVNVNEPLSPILGSQRIPRKPIKVIKFPSLDKFTATQENSQRNNGVSNNPKELKESIIPKITTGIDEEDNLVRFTIKKRRISNYTFHPSLQVEQCHIPCVGKQDKENTADSLKPFISVHTRHQTEASRSRNDNSTSNDDLEIPSHKKQLQSIIPVINDDDPASCGSKGVLQWKKEVIQNVKNNSKVHAYFSTLRKSLVQQDQHVADNNIDELIDNPVSPVITPEIQESDSQPDYFIDVTVTPPKKFQNGCMALSLESDIPSISSESVPSPATVNEDVSGNLKSGFSWVRNLQQQTTPQKQSADGTENAVESAKKKPKKDGEAARLRRLLVSWQSNINTWTHQLSLSSLHGNTPPQHFSTISDVADRKPLLPSPLNNHLARIKQDRVNDRTPLSPMSVNKPQSRAKQVEPDVKSNTKIGRSPAVRNLQDLLIESPVSSPGVSSLTHIQIPMSKKYMELRVAQVGGQLPGNSALCEVVCSSEEALQRTIKVEDLQEPTEKKISRQSKKYLVFFALQEHKIAAPLQVNDIAKVYSPWQTMDLPAHDVPVLFSSYFTLAKSPHQVKGQGQDRTVSTQAGHTQKYKHSVLTTWTCTCSSDPSVLPSMCEAQHCASTQGANSHNHTHLLLTVPSTFTTVTDSPQDLQPQVGSHTWTVMEGIERCGGASEVPVSLTARVHRSVTHRTSEGEVENWVLVCQDATGVFCTVKVPNRPLAQQLSTLLEGEQAGTHTLTHLTILNRLTNTQNPGLFSLISSLHSAYQSAVSSDPCLRPLLACPRPPQTSCYCFTVTLGSTRLLPCPEEVVLPLSLPCWSLQQAFEVRSEGQRGNLSLHLLYMVDSFLYVMSHGRTSGTQEEEDTQSTTRSDQKKKLITSHQHNEEKNKLSVTANKHQREHSTVRRLVIANRSSLPEWIPEQGTVMQWAVLRDLVVWRGNVIIDEYSCIEQEKEEGERERVSLSSLLRVLSPPSPFIQQHDLTLLSVSIMHDETSCGSHGLVETCGSSSAYSHLQKLRSTPLLVPISLRPGCEGSCEPTEPTQGSILKIDEDTAFTWPTCPKCGSENVQELGCGGVEEIGAQRGDVERVGVECTSCGVRSSKSARDFSLQVWISCKPQLQGTNVKVKLYQRTIEKLLSTCNTSSVEEYDAESLVGANVGPLVCVVQAISRQKHSTTPPHHSLLELPY